MLTDVALASVGGRNYILTADRDEHIRVSRGIPHTHVVEGFCLGHAEFVTRLCIPSGREGMLVSGGGDDELFVWEWQAGRLVSKVNLKSHVVSVMQNLGSGEETSGAAESMKITVSGIIHIPQPTADGVQDMVFVACEG
jgi:tRNA (guanine-N(7)-)-methyltransferase subunit TRM82